jgi:hypothetical protein
MDLERLGSHNSADDVMSILERDGGVIFDGLAPPGAVDSALSELAPWLALGSVLHGGGANVTEDQTRVGLAFGYTLGWLRQEENQYLAVPPEVAKGLPIELQRLIGYCEHAPLLGWTEGQDDALFRGGRSRESYETQIEGGRSRSLGAVLREGKLDP